MGTLSEFRKLAGSLNNPYIELWKANGGRVIGYYCTYVPGEIIHASGMLPYRMRATGSESSELGDVYSTHTTCAFCKHSLDQAMRGEYKFLDGLVAFYSCDHVRRMFDVWDHGKIEFPLSSFFLYFLSVPIKADGQAVDWLAAGLERLKRSLENHFQVTITDKALRQSIKAYNEKRRLLRSLYEQRKQEAPPITGAEVLEILIAGTAMRVEEFNRLLKKLLGELKGREGVCNYRARLLLGGSDLEDPAYIELIEELGGQVVTDSLCFGVRDFWDLVEEDSEPIPALARRYLKRVGCPRMMDYPQRDKFMKHLVGEFNVNGIIIQRIKYCDPWGLEGAMIERDMKRCGMPCMMLDREYVISSDGQMRTRVQAFLETIRR